MAEKLKFSPDDLTVGDMEDFEEIVGEPLDVALSERAVLMPNGEIEKDEKGRPVKRVQLNAKALKALIYIVKRADNPDFTLADARGVKVSEIDLGGEEVTDAEAKKEETA